MSSLDPSSLQLIVYPGTTSQFIEKYGRSETGKFCAAFWRRLPKSRIPNFFCEDPIIPYSGSTRSFIFQVAYKWLWDNRVKHLSLTKLDETTDEGVIAALQKYPYLESLTIRSQDMTNRSFQEIAKQTHLVRLTIFTHKNCKNMGWKAIEYLSTLPRLRELQVHDSNIYVDSKVISQFPVLEKLIGVSLATRAVLADPNSRLNSLFVSGCKGKTIHQIAEWTNLTQLGIPRSDINVEGMALLARHCSQLTVLDIRYCYSMKREGLFEIAKLVNLRQLQMREFYECDPVDFSSLTTLTNLEHLCIQRSSVHSKAILAFAQTLGKLKHFHANASKLQKFEVSEEMFGPLEVITAIGSMTKLESLSLNANRHDTVPLKNLTNLQKLKIAYSAINPKTLEIFSSQLTQLRELSLSCCRDAFPKGQQTLSLPLFQRLTLLRFELEFLTNIKDRGIGVMPQLLGLSLNGTKVKDGDVGMMVSCCPALTSLDLSGCKNIGDPALVSISEGLKALTYLNLRGTEIGDGGVEALLGGLPRLRDLKFSFTQVTDASIPSLSAKATQGLEFAYTYGSKMTYTGEESLHSRLSKQYHPRGKKLQKPVWDQ